MSEEYKDLKEKIADLEKRIQSQQRQIELLKEAVLTGKKNEFVSLKKGEIIEECSPHESLKRAFAEVVCQSEN